MTSGIAKMSLPFISSRLHLSSDNPQAMSAPARGANLLDANWQRCAVLFSSAISSPARLRRWKIRPEWVVRQTVFENLHRPSWDRSRRFVLTTFQTATSRLSSDCCKWQAKDLWHAYKSAAGIGGCRAALCIRSISASTRCAHRFYKCAP